MFSINVINKKIKLLITLFVLTVGIVLYYLYFLFDNRADDLIKKNVIKNSKAEIIKNIDSIFYTFGINKEWIKNTFPKDTKNKKDQMWFSKEVIIPRDLPTINLNFEISNYLKNNNLREKVVEDPKTKNVVMNIFSIEENKQNLVGNLKFIYSDSVKRNRTDVCLILDSLEFYSSSDVETILNSTLEFSVILPIENDKAEVQFLIIDSKRDFLIQFSIGQEDDLSADFKRGMSENTWKSKIIKVALNYPKASGIVLNNYNGTREFNNIIKENFLKNNLRVYEDTIFSQYKKNEEMINSLFKDIISKSPDKKYLFYKVNFAPTDLIYFEKEVYKLKKLGYRFYTFKEIIKRINEQMLNKNG